MMEYLPLLPPVQEGHLMNRPVRPVAVGLAMAAVALFAQACGKTSSAAPDGPATEITIAGVTTGIGEISTVLPICRPAGSQAPSSAVAPPADASVWLTKALEYHRIAAGEAGFQPQRLTSQKPADKLGDCGGRLTYPVYNHSNGTTTGTYAFENYCTIDDETGERTTLNGSMSFTNAGTPTNSGPITNKIEASSPAGITEITRSASGQTLSSKRISFEDYVYTPGIPGSEPTSSKPDKLTAKSVTVSNQVTGKSYVHTDYTMSYFVTSSGGEQMTVTGRGYRSNGEYYDVKTTTPVTADSDGDFTGGKISFTGANGSEAVLTVVPGSTLQGTMTVNGQPVTNVPVCK